MAVDFDVTSLHHRHATRRWERTSVGDLLERMTWSFPDKDAIIGREGAYGDEAFRRLTYRQADQIANQVAHGLLARGLERGDVIMLFCENSIEGYLVKVAAAKAGLVCAPVNPMMAPDMLAAMIKLVTPRLAVEAVTAVVVRTPGDSTSEAGLIAFCRASLGGYETPKSVVFAESLPETVGGKVLKYKLRVSYAGHYESAEAAP
jgi:acyl-CoA synthetase (AMP-forming)/AMP-acid ligase II